MDGDTVLLVGLCTVDVVQRVARLPRPGDKIQSESVEAVAGGPAANAAVAVAALGGRARLVTALGAHPLAGLARDDLATHGVEVLDADPDRATPPPVSAVTVRSGDGERVVVSHNAADAPATRPPAPWPDLLADADALLVDGHHPALAVGAASAARERGVPVVLDAGSDKPVLAELLPLVDVCACSAAFRLGGLDAAATEEALRGRVPVVLRTAGAGPVRWWAGGADGKVDPPAVAARDTLGAGDVWHGALAYGVAALGRVPRAADLPDLVDAANRLAARRVAHVGARAWLPADRMTG